LDDDIPNPLFLLFQVASSAPWDGLLLLFLIFCILITCSGLVSASEVAYFSLGLKEVKALEEQDTHASKRALALKQKPRYLLATILIANNFVNIAIVIVADQILKSLIGPDVLLMVGTWLYKNIFYGFSTPEVLAEGFNFLITVVGVTFILLLFGEAMPKIYATLNKLKIVHFMSGPLTLLLYIFSPVSKILVGWSTAMESRLSNSAAAGSTSKEDIDAAIDLTVSGTSAAAVREADILKGIVNFGDTSAKQIMRPRMDIVAIEEQLNFKEVMKIVRESGYSRLPVYREELDAIIGILYVKDLLSFTEEKESFAWQQLIRNSVLFVPESKKIDELLREFQEKRVHLGVIVDEYGGTAGIATLEDIMEEVVGEIKDEFDQDEEVDYVRIADNSYIFDGKTLLNDVCRITGISTNFFDDFRGEADSIGGLILEMTGTIPTSEKEISLSHINLKVISVTKRRIEKVSLIINES
jgi:putative hemolysin